MRRPTAVTVLAVLQFLGALLCVPVLLLLVGISTQVGDDGVAFLLQAVGGLLAGLSVLQVVCGIGLWKLRNYGRVLQIGFAAIGLLNIPVGTVIGILILVYLTKPGIKLLFSGRPAATLSPEEHQQIAAAQDANGVVIAVAVVAGVFLVVVAAGIVAAIAIPGLLRARLVDNEAKAEARVAAVQTAQASHAAMNGGQYADLSCLVDPRSCDPGSTQAALLDPSYIEAEPLPGYRFRFQGGPSATPDLIERAAGSPRGRLQSYAYLAEPTESIGRAGRGRARFCADSSGALCRLPNGIYPNRGKCGCR